MGAAHSGESVGATGFFLGVPSEIEGRTHLYGVTNQHNIEKGSGAPILRAKKRDGALEFIQARREDWAACPGHDISVLPIDPNIAPYFECIGVDICLGADDVQAHSLGAGDNVFMLGRFSGYDGGSENCPYARFGNFSINNAILHHPIYGMQESFVVEMRSISGYSGSPVFIYWDFFDMMKGNKSRGEAFSTFFALLGIDWGHIPYKTKVKTHDGRLHPDGSYVDDHTAMSGVVPAWHLENFLNTHDLQRSARRTMLPYLKSNPRVHFQL